MDVKKNRGFSLIGILIGAAISSLVLFGLITTFVTLKDKYNLYKDKTTADAKQLLVKSILYDFVKDVGFACKFGYSEQSRFDRTGDSLDDFFVNTSALQVGKLPLTTSNHLPEFLEQGCSQKCYQAGTDYIMVKKEEDHTSLTNTNILGTTLNVVSADGIEAGDYLFLCGKNHINILKANSVNTQTNSISLSQAPVQSNYYPGDYLGEYSFEILYVGDSGVNDDSGNNIRSLYLYVKNDDSQGETYELVRDVSDLHIDRVDSIRDGTISWQRISSDVDLEASNDTAIRISFDIDGESYSKIANI